MRAPTIPSQPLDRFHEILRQLETRRTWSVGHTALRYLAQSMLTSDARPYELADRVFSVAETLKKTSSAFSQLRGDLRFLIAAQLLERRVSAERFHTAVSQFDQKLKQIGMRRSSLHQLMAIVLMLEPETGQVAPGRVERFHKAYEMMKRYHWWLTGPDDFASCALFAMRDESIHDIGRRVERLYTGLRERGFAASDPLQLVSHILWFNPKSDAVALSRFQGLHDGFKGASIAMWTSDYDELATLTFLDHRPKAIIDTVVRHRESMKALRPRCDASMTFSLACGTAFLELVALDSSLKGIHDARGMMHVHAALAAQQASSAAIMSATMTAAVVAANSSS